MQGDVTNIIAQRKHHLQGDLYHQLLSFINKYDFRKRFKKDADKLQENSGKGTEQGSFFCDRQLYVNILFLKNTIWEDVKHLSDTINR